MTTYLLSDSELLALNSRFSYHAPRPDQVERYQKIREAAKDLALVFSACCPPSRELSTALTQLTLANMMANAAIACNEKEST